MSNQLETGRWRKIFNAILKTDRRHLTLLVTTTIITGLLSWAFLELADELLENELTRFDVLFLSIVTSLQSPAVSRFMSVITLLGYEGIIAGTTMIVVYFLTTKKIKKGMWFGIIISLGGLLNTLLKVLFQRSRPETNVINAVATEAGFSFPSGHSMGAMVFYGALVYLTVVAPLSTYAKWLLAGLWCSLIILVGISRIYLGVHYPSDVLAGWLVGGTYLGLVYGTILNRRIFKQKKLS